MTMKTFKYTYVSDSGSSTYSTIEAPNVMQARILAESRHPDVATSNATVSGFVEA